MKKIYDVKPFEEEFELLEMDAVRIIGLEIACSDPKGQEAALIWNDLLGTKAHEQLVALPDVLNGEALFGFMVNPKADGSFTYLLGAMTPAGTAVPEGFAYMDLPGGTVAKGCFGDSLTKTIERIKEKGFAPNWTPFTWNAEMFFQAEDEQYGDTNLMPRRWIIPVK